jgi:hypothetical protein
MIKKLIDSFVVVALMFFISILCPGKCFGNQEGSRLYHAASLNRLEEVKDLIRRGANLNWQEEDGSTPLMIASMFGYSEIAHELIKAGADVNIKAADGITTALSLASGPSIIDKMWQIVKELVDAGAYVNVKDANSGRTPLFNAVVSGNAERVRYFIKAGSDTQIKDSNGQTALDRALKDNNQNIVKILKEAGAK